MKRVMSTTAELKFVLFTHWSKYKKKVAETQHNADISDIVDIAFEDAASWRNLAYGFHIQDFFFDSAAASRSRKHQKDKR